jgi:hypothetical protein
VFVLTQVRSRESQLAGGVNAVGSGGGENLVCDPVTLATLSSGPVVLLGTDPGVSAIGDCFAMVLYRSLAFWEV